METQLKRFAWIPKAPEPSELATIVVGSVALQVFGSGHLTGIVRKHLPSTKLLNIFSCLKL